jgi:2-oxoglutarate/2-oxoacid ferredoxin oxidoreductase subunit beta
MTKTATKTPDKKAKEKPMPEHPLEPYLRMDRIPHIWCPTCGIGTAVSCFIQAIIETGIDVDKLCIVSGIGCTARVPGYLKMDSYHTTHGRAIPFATGLKLANPELEVVVFSGDGDLIAIGGNHFIHAARRNMDIKIVCVNNFIYGMTGGQVAPTTPLTANCSTTPYGNSETPFSLPYLAASCGATYVARWTALHIRRLTRSMGEMLTRRGFSFTEVLAPCSTLYARRNKLGSGLSLMKFYHDNSEICHGADVNDLDIDYQSTIKVGKFIDVDKPTHIDRANVQFKKVFGDKYNWYGPKPPGMES